MTTAQLSHIPLASAFLCANCNSIGNSPTFCPACAGANLLALAPVLDRSMETYPEQPAHAGRYASASAISITEQETRTQALRHQGENMNLNLNDLKALMAAPAPQPRKGAER